MCHYLLDEQHAPLGTAHTISPYDSPNPADAPAQTLYPAHRVQSAHEYSIWSMAWHPLGHILATGSNDKATRFWTRPRPGARDYVNDRWHIGQAAAEAQGTWKKSDAQRQREQEEAEADEEAEGLVDQKMPSKQSFLPGLPGLPGLLAPPPPMPFPDGTSTGGAQTMQMPAFGNSAPPPFPMPNLPGQPPMDLEALKQAFGGQLPPPPPGGLPFPAGMPVQLPPGFSMPPGMAGLPGMAPQASDPSSNSSRRRAPLPSQQESLQQEMRQGRYTKAR